MVQYYARILEMEDNRLPKRVFMSTRNSTRGWAGELQKVLEAYSLDCYLDSISPVPQELMDFYMREKIKEDLRSSIDGMSKLQTYKELRVGLEMGCQV